MADTTTIPLTLEERLPLGEVFTVEASWETFLRSGTAASSVHRQRIAYRCQLLARRASGSSKNLLFPK